MKEYKKRIADKLLKYRLEEVGAVLVEGPKWCGKNDHRRAACKKRVIYGGSKHKKQQLGNG